MSRIVAREISMKYLYGMDLNKLWDEELETVDKESEVFEGYVNENDDLDDDSDLPYINCVVSGVKENRDEIDRLIEENSRSWKINRFSKIDLAILRVAVFEIIYINKIFKEDGETPEFDNIPYQVAINEAVRVAKKYGTKESSKFVNGILGGIVRSQGIA